MSQDDRASVLVLGAQHPTGLTTARALRDCGARIIGLAYGESPCLRSSVWSSVLRTERNPQDVLQAVAATAERHGGPLLLLPADDESVKILSDQRHLLPPSCLLCMPDAATVDLLLDKSKFYSWAQEHSFPVPATIEVSSFDKLDSAIQELGYPLLLKPTYRTGRWDREIPADKVLILEYSEQRTTIPKSIFSIAPLLLVQQWIPGSDADIYFCLVGYDRHGKLLDYFCGRKLMQWPPLGGSTAVAISDEQEESRDLTLALFDTLGYKGLGSVEYKKDPQTGKLYIMEPTVGRNDFQSGLAIAGNVNLTDCVFLDALGKKGTVKGNRHRSAWICEPSLYYAMKYYLRRNDRSLFQIFRCFFKKIGFCYFEMKDKKPFGAFLKSKLR
jgi:predicted ATP-grasp superfamily ATP-dependent carboligase